MRSLILPFLLAALIPTAPLSAQSPEPTENPDPLFTPEDLRFAAGFVGVTAAMFPLDRYLAGLLQDSTRQSNPVLRWSAHAVGEVGRRARS